MKEIKCPICSNDLSVRTAKGRKSNKPFIMLVCQYDGRHFRGFITDQQYVKTVLNIRSGRQDDKQSGNFK